MARTTLIQVRKDNEDAWVAAQTAAGATTILATGEIGYVISGGANNNNVGRFKIGDGTTLWGALTYAADASKISGTTLSTSVTTANGLTTATSLATVGTITTGTWNGGVIPGQYGGTGATNTNKTITLGGNLTTSGAFNTTLTVTGTTSVSLPTSGTLIGNADTGTVTATMLAPYASAPTLWFSATADNAISMAAAGNINTSMYDPFGLTNGATVATNSTYLVDYYLTGTISNGSGQTQSIRLGITGDAVSNFTFATALGMGAAATSTGSTWALQNQIGYVNTANLNQITSIGSVTSSQTSMSFSLRIQGILRTGSTGSYFRPKIGVNNASSTVVTVQRESYGSLRLLGSNTDFKYPTGSWS
jgi:hypothetical protein